MSERHACRLLGLGRSTHRYQARRNERDAALRARLRELAVKRMRFGYRRLTAMLAREGMPANHKRVYRLYREEGLAMRIRQRRRIRWTGVVSSAVATRANQRWSIDFVSDCVSTGRVIRMSQETVAAQQMLTRFATWQGRKPESIAADTTYGNGEFLQWLAERNITPYMRTRDSIHRKRSPFFGPECFTYEPEPDRYICPAGQPLNYGGRSHRNHA